MTTDQVGASPNPTPASEEVEDSSKTGNVYKMASKDGHFHRQVSSFRSWVTPSSDKTAQFPAAKGRYALYINYGCPWAHRANIMRSLKKLENMIQLIVLDYELGPEGWFFSGRDGTDAKDPLYGHTKIKALYLHADPEYNARYTVPVLWDKERETVVNNESSEIIRMLESCFDEFLPAEEKEDNKGGSGLYPQNLRQEIDSFNAFMYDSINNGVYKTGFAGTQEAYDSHLFPLFKALDDVEGHLQESSHQPYLFGKHITEADVRLYTTLVRFDSAYFTMFKCNLKMIRDEREYPRLHRWLRVLYWGEEKAFRETTNFEHIKKGYAKAIKSSIVPGGPYPDILPLDA